MPAFHRTLSSLSTLLAVTVAVATAATLAPSAAHAYPAPAEPASTVSSAAASPAAASATTSAVTWTSGAYLGNGGGKSVASSFAAYRGSPLTVAEIYPPRDSWSNMANDSYLIKQYAGFAGRLSVGLPLTIGRTTLKSVAAGKADRYFTTFAKNLNAQNRGTSDLRLGWEFNGSWYPWAAKDPVTYLAAFRHVSRVLKATLPHATIDWNGNWGGSQVHHDPFTQLYPGDSYVDVVGLDAYDGGWVAANTDAKFANWKNYRFSLQAWFNFAVKHGKKFAMAEWGLVADGEKDNPVFIRNMYKFFQQNASHLAYEAYFNSSGSSLYGPNRYPRSSAEYKKMWSQTTSRKAPRMVASVRNTSIRKGARTVLSVRSLPGVATGTVTFAAGRTVACTARVSGGRASCTTKSSLQPGVYKTRASWPGDAHWLPVSRTVTFTITR